MALFEVICSFNRLSLIDSLQRKNVTVPLHRWTFSSEMKKLDEALLICFQFLSTFLHNYSNAVDIIISPTLTSKLLNEIQYLKECLNFNSNNNEKNFKDIY